MGAAGIAASGVAAEPVERAPVLLIAGQSRDEFGEYLNEVSGRGHEAPLPGGAAFYTSLDLSGVKRPHANAPGDNFQDLPYLLMAQDPLVIQIGLWLSREQLYQIVAGERDAQIAELHAALQALQRPVFLRIGYEFDGPHNRYPPEVFAAAYRTIARPMRESADILLVWHSYAMLPTYMEHPLADWYPGDEWVDWIGVSFFQVTNEGYHEAPNREAVLAFAREKAKPVLVAEASAIRYTVRQKQQGGAAYWDYWYKPFFEFVEGNPEIRAVSIINVNWDSQNQHRALDWGDARINADPEILQRWRARANAPYWMPVDRNLYQAVRKITRPGSAPFSKE